MKRIGVFGGTFNPIHVAHLRLAQDVIENYRFEKIIFIPNFTPPHKNIDVWIDPIHRLNMVKLAIQGNPDFLYEDVEFKRGGVSYTIDTIRFLYDKYKFEGKPGFLLGSDLIGDIGAWKDIRELANLVEFIVLWRYETTSVGKINGRNTKVDINFKDSTPEIINISIGDGGAGEFSITIDKIVCRRMDITASEIRRMIRTGKSVRYLVTGEVFDYIEKHRLYR